MSTANELVEETRELQMSLFEAALRAGQADVIIFITEEPNDDIRGIWVPRIEFVLRGPIEMIKVMRDPPEFDALAGGVPFWLVVAPKGDAPGMIWPAAYCPGEAIGDA